MTKRSRIEIIGDILRVTGKSKTQLYYSSGLSHSLFKRYMAFLVSKDYLRVGLDGYEITLSGMAVRDDIDKLVDKLRPVFEK